MRSNFCLFSESQQRQIRLVRSQRPGQPRSADVLRLQRGRAARCVRLVRDEPGELNVKLAVHQEPGLRNANFIPTQDPSSGTEY